MSAVQSRESVHIGRNPLQENPALKYPVTTGLLVNGQVVLLDVVWGSRKDWYLVRTG